MIQKGKGPPAPSLSRLRAYSLLFVPVCPGEFPKTLPKWLRFISTSRLRHAISFADELFAIAYSRKQRL